MMKRQKSINVIKKRETESWIYSYADLITNLMTLFVMLLIISTGSKTQASKFKQGLEEYSKSKADSKLLSGSGASNIDDLKQIISDRINELGLASKVSLSTTSTGLELTFESSLLFESSTAQISDSATILLTQVAKLVELVPRRYLLDVEGHADSRPVTSGLYPSNWELSSARAGSVVRYLEALGIGSQRMKAIGYGSTRPLDNTGIGEINRRVVLKINSTMDGE
jgi:chemotaxis protein MotB